MSRARVARSLTFVSSKQANKFSNRTRLAVSAGGAQTKSVMRSVNQHAPVYSTKSIVINATPQKVWETLANINEWNQWLTTVSKSQLNGPLQPGTTFDWTTGGTNIHSTLHTVEPFANFGWTGKIYGVFAIHNWEFNQITGHTSTGVSKVSERWILSSE